MAADYETAVYSLYRYQPSLGAAVVATIFFLLTTAVHTWQMIRTRTWFYLPLVIGGSFEWIGYIGRAVNSPQTPNWVLGPFVLQSLLLLIAPALFAATIYMTLGRLTRACHTERYLLINPRYLTRLFVSGDIFCFTIQAGGGGIMAGGSLNSLQTGADIVVGGLFVQVLFFGLFVAVGSVWHVRMNAQSRRGRMGTVTDQQPLIETDMPWRKHMATLYAASALILVRSLYRIIEYLQGNDGYIMRNEWTLYVFDFLLMFAVLVIFNFMHGSEIGAALKRTQLSGNDFGLESARDATVKTSQNKSSR